MTPDQPAQPSQPAQSDADAVASAVRAVAGVVDLHGGSFGVGTYLPGRRVVGVRLGEDVAEIHVSVEMGTSVPTVAADIAAAVGPLAGTPVDVYVEDVVARAPSTS